MPEAKLVLTIPDRAWPGAITRDYPGTRLTVLAALPDEGGGTGLAEVHSETLDAVLTDVREHATVDALDVLERTDERALIQFRTQLPLLVLAARDSGLPLRTPFDVVDGEAEWTLTATRESLSTLADRLSAMGVDFDVEYIREEPTSPDDLLTEAQRELLCEAVARGYYDTPRGCSLTDLAAAVGLAKSTASETLHRAEERVLKEFVERNLDVDAERADAA